MKNVIKLLLLVLAFGSISKETFASSRSGSTETWYCEASCGGEHREAVVTGVVQIFGYKVISDLAWGEGTTMGDAFGRMANNCDNLFKRNHRDLANEYRPILHKGLDPNYIEPNIYVRSGLYTRSAILLRATLTNSCQRE